MPDLSPPRKERALSPEEQRAPGVHRLADADLVELSSLMERHAFPAGARILDPSTAPRRVYLVYEGVVRLYHCTPSGLEITAGVLGRGYLFGVSALFDGPPDTLYAEAQTDVLVRSADGRSFLDALGERREVMVHLALQLGSQIAATESQLSRVAVTDTRTRLVGELARLARESSVVGRAGRLLAPLTQLELARQIGASRETVSRLLASLEEDGWILRQGRRIVVPDPRALSEAFGIEEDPSPAASPEGDRL